MRIVFMGTPEFAVTALQKLLESKHDVVGVITAPDQAAGRGKKIRMSAVKEFALANHLTLLQPTNLKDPLFIEELRSLMADIQVVVAFRMLPEIVWDMPSKGTFNLHASLLPQYRGAAPINHAIMNGESETGVTTFFLDKAIDTGSIIMQKKCVISAEDDFGSLHDKLMILGADLIIDTLDAVDAGNHKIRSQSELITDISVLKPAPKIFKENCELDWKRDGQTIVNKIKGLSPYPAAYSYLQIEGEQKTIYMKVFKAQLVNTEYPISKPGYIYTDSKTYIHVSSAHGIISIEEVQLEGKKRMSILDFLRGFNLTSEYSFRTLI